LAELFKQWRCRNRTGIFVQSDSDYGFVCVVVVVEETGGAIGMGWVVVVVLSVVVGATEAAGGGLTMHPPKADTLPNSKTLSARRKPRLLTVIFASPVGDGICVY
jgi:hypothetical protein